MYSTGAWVAFITNVGLAYLNILPPLYSGSGSRVANALGVLFLELANAMIPLIAIALDRPLKAGLTAVLYVFVGLTVWTMKYESNKGF